MVVADGFEAALSQPDGAPAGVQSLDHLCEGKEDGGMQIERELQGRSDGADLGACAWRRAMEGISAQALRKLSV
eukprot:391883-Rhodomonas_salina.2